ncbi:Peptide-N4-(N-acetyl-beta-glucosaminyl) asparagine amidase A [Dionaea muscipula]
MHPSILLLLLLLLPVSLLHPSSAGVGRIHHRLPIFSELTTNQPPATAGADVPPTAYFEVTKPIKHPNTEPCSYTILQHDFGYTYGKPPVLAAYTPPTKSNCPSTDFSTIVLEWNATCKGRQYDRIFGVWLGGVEILRSCTAEPRATGIVWKVEKDITKYYSLLMTNQTLAVYLGNLVTDVYTGVYHVNITIHFYPSPPEHMAAAAVAAIGDSAVAWDAVKPRSGNHRWADSIVPISRNLPLNDGLWYEVENSTDVQSQEFQIPQNVYRAVLEVYVSFHENDEFWYSNYPNEYITANNLTGTPGNGPFREVVVRIDGEVVGAIWPFTVIYTGGVNPLLWRPITGIGSFDLPSYDIEITPFLEKLLDGKTHRVEFSVTNALNVWYIDANLQLWIDGKSKRTAGKLFKHRVEPLKLSTKLDFNGLDGHFTTKATRSVSSAGWVESSTYGKMVTYSSRRLTYINYMKMGNDGNLQIVNQTIGFETSVSTHRSGSGFHLIKLSSYKSFPLFLYTNVVANQGTNGAYDLVTRVDFAFDQHKTASSSEHGTLWRSSLRNTQNATGKMVVEDNLVVAGVGSTQQAYKFDAKYCYFRNVSSSNYTILYDQVSNKCGKEAAASPLSFEFGQFWHRARTVVPVL